MIETEEAAEDFLLRFKAGTEAAWARLEAPVIEQKSFHLSGVETGFWQPHTRWSGGLSEAEVQDLERKYGWTFPPDYRLFLRMLHTPNTPMIGGNYDLNGCLLEIGYGSPFRNWLHDELIMDEHYEWWAKGMAFDAEWNNVCFSGWGEKTGNQEADRALIKLWCRGIQDVIPIIQGQVLPTKPAQFGNHLFSFHQSEVMFFYTSFFDYLEQFWKVVLEGAQGDGIAHTMFRAESDRQRFRQTQPQVYALWEYQQERFRELDMRGRGRRPSRSRG